MLHFFRAVVERQRRTPFDRQMVAHSACKVIVRWQSARSADHGRCTLHPNPTPTRHRAPHTDQMSPTARTARPTPRFHAYFADSIYVALVQERAFGMVCNVQVRALWPCGSDAPRLDLRACRLAIEWPLAATLDSLTLPPRESQVARQHAIRSRRAQLNMCRAVRCD